MAESRKEIWKRMRSKYSIFQLTYGIILLPLWWPMKGILKGIIYVCGKIIDCAYWLDAKM